METLSQIRPVWAEVDLDAFAFTMGEICKRARADKPDRHVCAVVKADAYGHGAVRVVPTLLKAGADFLAVAVIDEAIQLRQAGITDVPILILGYTEPQRAAELVKYDIHQATFTYELAKALSDAAVAQNKTAHIHIKADTGMGRIGFLPTEENIDTIEKIFQLPNVEFTGLFTHFSSADMGDEVSLEYTQKQWACYNWFLDELKKRGLAPKIRHCSNSAAIVDHPEFFLDMVRPGIILYGCYPSDATHNENIDIKPEMTLKCRISNVKHEKPGQSISYGRHYTTTLEDEVIATLPIGYADGFFRHFSNNNEVLIHGKRCPIVGNVCMDQCMVNVTGVDNVRIGDEVVLMGHQGDEYIPCEELVERTGTIPHEFFCDISKRVPRVYMKDGKIVEVYHPLYQ